MLSSVLATSLPRKKSDIWEIYQVVKANQDSTERKRIQKLAEEEEDRKVLQYLLEKEQREIENDKIAAAKKAERELELARLRAAQEKVRFWATWERSEGWYCGWVGDGTSNTRN